MTMDTFSKNLITWYLENKRTLPWRQTKEPYRIWLSEIILQQTRVQQGLPYYQRFVDTFPTVNALADASEEKVLKLWQGLGYYTRARNLHHTAKYVAYELNGQFPNDYEGLKQLKGVGDYTASAIASICFDEPTPVVDGNVYRVLARHFGIKTPINSTQGVKEFKALAQQLIDPTQPATFNQAIMEFGATQCKPQSPYCLHCPIQQSCVALATNKIEELPVKLKKLKVKERYFNYLFIQSEQDETVVEQRVDKGIWHKLFQFPLIEGKMISQKEIVKHEKLENTEVLAVKKNNDVPIVHKLSHQHIYTTFWHVSVKKIAGEKIPMNALKDYPVPVLIHNFVESLDFI